MCGDCVVIAEYTAAIALFDVVMGKQKLFIILN